LFMIKRETHRPGVAFLSTLIGLGIFFVSPAVSYAGAQIAGAIPQPTVTTAPTQVSTARERVRREQSALQEGTLRPRNASFLRLPERPHGLVLLFHGFTAGPWQFDELSERLNAAGFAVYAVRLPGHGEQRDGAPYSAALPNGQTWQQYTQFNRTVVAEASALAQEMDIPLDVVGFSLGGAQAVQAALEAGHRVHKVALVAPLMHFALGIVPWAVSAADRMQGCDDDTLLGRFEPPPIWWTPLVRRKMRRGVIHDEEKTTKFYG
jgi:alpha-beta hydrolase superfamily lysophospholipase